MTNFQRNLSLEDDWVAVRNAPFTENDGYSMPAVAVDWNNAFTAFNITLLTINCNESYERLWSDSFTISKIKRLHFEMCLVFPELEQYFPALPRESAGLWGYVRWIRVTSKHCKNLEEYIKQAFNTCGWKLFTSIFFEEPLCDEDFTIPTLQLKRKKYEKAIETSVAEFSQFLAKKSDVKECDSLVMWYKQLVDVFGSVQEAEMKLLRFDCEPFEELRDIAQKERSLVNQQTQATLDENQWEQQYIDSVTRLNKFRTNYFNTILSRFNQVFEATNCDREKISDTEDHEIMEKIDFFEKDFIKHEVRLLNCNHEEQVLARDKLRQDTLALDDITPEVLAEQEKAFYNKQSEILQLECNIQDKYEVLAKLDLNKIDINNADETMLKKKEKMNQHLSNIARKKALLRNKMRDCEAELRKMNEKQIEQEEQFITHHAVQMKIDNRRQEDEAKKTERLEERQKTLLRLKEYKNKHFKPKEVKPPRYQAPSLRAKNGTKTTLENKKKKRKPSQSDTSQSTTNIPQSTTSAPQRTTNIPQSTTSAPQSTTDIPDISQSTTNVSKSTTKIPRSTTSIPQTTTCIPLSTTNIPQSTTDISDIPQSTTNIAERTTNTPRSTTSIPPPPPPPPPPVVSFQTSVTNANQNPSERNNNNDSGSLNNQPNSLSSETIEIDALLLARSRLKKNAVDKTGSTGFPSGQELTRAIRSVKLRKIPVNKEEKSHDSDLSKDGAEFLRKALERMNRFTTLSDTEDDDLIEQDW